MKLASFSLLFFIEFGLGLALATNETVDPWHGRTAIPPSHDPPEQSSAMRKYLLATHKRSKAFESYCSQINSTEAVGVNLNQHDQGYLMSHDTFSATWPNINETYDNVPIICKWRLQAKKLQSHEQQTHRPRKFHEDAMEVLSFTFEAFDIPREPFQADKHYVGAPGFHCAWSFARFYLIDKDERRQVIAEFCGRGWVPGFDVPITDDSAILVHVKLLDPFRGFRIFYEHVTRRIVESDFIANDTDATLRRVVQHDDSYSESDVVPSIYALGNSSRYYDEACESDTGLQLTSFSGKIRFVQALNTSVWCRWVLHPLLEPSQQLKYIKFRIPRFDIEKSNKPCEQNVLDLKFADPENVTRFTSYCEMKLPQNERWQKVETITGIDVIFKSTSINAEAGFELEYYAVLMSQEFHAEAVQQCGISLFPAGRVIPGGPVGDLVSLPMSPQLVPLANETLLSRKKRIVGGELARPGSWPWTAMLSFFGFQLCAATILTDRWLLTAAHCFKNERKNVIGWEVIIGKQTADTAGQVAWDYRSVALRPTIEMILTHYRYGRGRNPKEFDIALVKVEQSIPFDGLASPVCPPSRPLGGDETCYVVGFGETNNTESAGFLNEARVPIISNDDCRLMNPYYSQYVTESMLCAGYEAGGIDNCRGDNGGPLVCAVNNRWELHGVVSWGKGCAKKSAPGVYTRVSSYLHWIQKVINTYQ